MRLFGDEPYLSALADVYDVFPSAVLLTDSDMKPVYFNRTAGLYYGQICETDGLKKLMTPQTVRDVRKMLKEKDAVRVELTRGGFFNAVVFTKMYDRTGKTAAFRVQTEAQTPDGGMFSERGTVENMLRLELLAPCADILRSARELREAGRKDTAVLKRMEMNAFACLRFAAKLTDSLTVTSSAAKSVNLLAFVLRFAEEYRLDVSKLICEDAVIIVADAEKLYRTLCVCLQELISLPPTGKYRTHPTVCVTQDEKYARILLRRMRVREDASRDTVLTDLSLMRLGGTVERTSPNRTNGTAEILLSFAKAEALSPEYRLSDVQKEEFDRLGGLLGEILSVLLLS